MKKFDITITKVIEHDSNKEAFKVLIIGTIYTETTIVGVDKVFADTIVFTKDDILNVIKKYTGVSQCVLDTFVIDLRKKENVIKYKKFTTIREKINYLVNNKEAYEVEPSENIIFSKVVEIFESYGYKKGIMNISSWESYYNVDFTKDDDTITVYGSLYYGNISEMGRD